MRIAFTIAALLATTTLPVAAEEPCEQLVYGGPCRPVAAETPAGVGAETVVRRPSRGGRVLRPVTDTDDNRDVLGAANAADAPVVRTSRVRRDRAARPGRVLRPVGDGNRATSSATAGIDLSIDDSGVVGGGNRSASAARGTGNAQAGSDSRGNVERAATAAQSAGGTSAVRGYSRGNLGGAASPGGQGGAPAASGSGGIGSGRGNGGGGVGPG